jgi:hypothetical protein
MESQHSIPSVESSGPVQVCNGIALPLFLRLYADTCSDVSGDSDNEILDSDSDVPTTGLNKQLPLCAIVFSSDSETSTEEEESCEMESSDDKTSNLWCKTDKKNPSNVPFLGSTGLSIVIDNPEPVKGKLIHL